MEATSLSAVYAVASVQDDSVSQPRGLVDWWIQVLPICVAGMPV